MNKKLKSISCILAATCTFLVAENTMKVGPLAVDVVSAATGEAPAPAPAPTPKPTTSTKTTTTTTSTSYTSGSVSRLLALCSAGNDVKLIQTNLNSKGYKLTVDGFFGNLTLNAVKAFQKANGLAVDGVVGPNTLAVLIPSSAVPTSITNVGSVGNDVKYLQTNLNKLGYKLSVDGIFGNLTSAAVKSFQKANGLAVDGIAGPKTFAKLFEKVSAPAPTTTTTPTAEQTVIKIGRADYNAHGSGVTNAIVAMAGDKIAAVTVDEYQFMDPTKIAEPLPNTAKLGANYLDATKSVLASKLKNTVYYSGNMKTSAGATQTWDANMAGVQKYAIGKTIAELDAAIMANKNADGTDKDAKVDAVTGATFASTNGYLSAILAAAQNAAAAKVSSTIDSSQLNNLKLGRTEYNAHGSGVTITGALTLGDKIIAASVDEYQFMDPTKIAAPLPNTAKLGANYKDATKNVLASKLVNTVYYSGNMKTSAGATQTWDENMAGVVSFATGKTITELDTAIKGNKNADGTDKDAKVDAVSSATFASTNGYLSSILEAAKVAK